ncbi:hypothetical protein C7S16_3384 [Burkholderia thailandensis]|uniref:Uncharacterized protein n=1 Tax=Burkholderia thailandensis TaxID=57975 RepID=A0AAW9D6T6_BURTH|nr:hypothetical protein [Burkholderia thailandensis]MDW9257691.1 hypothetical protein [Burkholderia thailandensis]
MIPRRPADSAWSTGRPIARRPVAFAAEAVARSRIDALPLTFPHFRSHVSR